MRDFFSGFSFTGWDAVLALAIVVGAWFLARYARRAADRILSQVKVPHDLRDLGVQATGYVVIFLGVGVALSFLGASIQPVLAVVVMAAAVTFLALRGIADNVAAGVIIQTRRPVRLDDSIEAMGFAGRVREINSRSVIIEAPDGRIVHLPNRRLLDDPLVNHTVMGRHASAIQVRIGAGYRADVVAIITEVLSQMPSVLAEPAPTVLVSAVETERTIMTATCWHHPAEGPVVTSAAVVAISDSLADLGPPVSVVAPPVEPAVLSPADV
ncbi:mechanosensitive ion channel-like protein [Haloactinopolyspora alba]|uniref:Mechanosensitive ion channel-like protein n=1 Tax=Haloactinopolyspora alba TaxID=648780 RepID=A0A2P8E032_9ACTN|nr:mechanosensitive ion channel domain-containing protein [Haloactinopolyspora alba]PSL02820.1 mechanosensitive ion channel-like protein [Haloactinopolyspora alba]